ncbi:MAG: sensor histidine kinase [Alkalilacustris sp.]
MGQARAGAPLRLTDRLAVRLAVLLTLAMLPLGLLAILATLDSRRTDVRSVERALVSMTADTEAGRRALVESALTTARALARPTLERLDDPEACRALMADTVDRAGVFSFAGFTGTDGVMACASGGAAQDFSESPVFNRMMEDRRALVRRAQTGAVTGRPVLIATHPVYDDGTLHGFLSIAIAEDSVAWLTPPGSEEIGLRPLLLNRWGEVLSGGESGDTLLPEGIDPAALTTATPAVFEGRTRDDARAVFTVATLVPGQLHVLGVWDPDAAAVAGLGGTVPPVLFALLMWLASIGTVYVAIHYLVIRHLRQLGQQMRRFALGSRIAPDPMPHGVVGELRDLAATFAKMAALVTRDEAELSRALADREAALAEKTLLLKEVHHRVKNNLQLIASILNLQMRRLRDDRTRRVLQNVQDRVISLATIHRSLYQSDQIGALRADHLLDELLRHLFSIGAEASGGAALHTELAPVTLEADQIVPLSLLLTEAVTNALKYAGQPGGGAWVRVELGEADGEVLLRLTNSVAPDPGAPEPGDADHASTGLGGELIAAFAAQLGARLDHGLRGEGATARWELAVRFTRSPADPAPAAPRTPVEAR